MIPVRLKSSRIKHKVLLNFPDDSGTLLSNKINQLTTFLPKSQIIISAGEEIFYEFAKNNGIRYSHRDDYFINGHQAGTAESIRAVICDVKTTHVMWTTVVTPLHDEIVLQRSLDIYLSNVNSKFDSLTTVSRVYEYLWQDYSPLNYFADERHPDSQFLPSLHKITNGVYIASRATMDQKGYFLGSSPYLHEVPKICSLDIDEIEDYKVAFDANKWYRTIPSYQKYLSCES